MTGPVGVVLAGGASRRMGTDKAFLQVDGVAMVAHVAGALREGGCASVWCQGGDAPRLAELGLTVRPDRRPGEGPVTAIAEALADPSAAAGVVVAACDLPGLTGAAVAALTARPGPAVLVADGRPGLVVWLPAGSRVRPGPRRFSDLLAALGAEHVDVPSAVLRNVNTPADL